jgi:FkbM family methyltransferase
MDSDSRGLSVVLGFVEPKQLGAARELATVNDICFDIGANVGLYSVLFARHCRHVVAFEPVPRNIRFLSRTLEVNSARNVTIVPCAVSDSTGLSRFQHGARWGVGRLSEAGDQPALTVSCDEFVHTQSIVPSLLKIDVEGAEMLVLSGARRLLAEQRPVILLSTHGEGVRKSCLDLLVEMGYTRIVPLDARRSQFAITPRSEMGRLIYWRRRSLVV